MKTKAKNLMLALIAVLASVSITSCSKDDDDPNKGIGNYYFQLDYVESNCADEKGNNLADALYENWISINKADSQGKIAIGKTDRETALAFFNKNINALVEEYTKAYRGKLPEWAFISFTFRLGSDAAFNGASKTATIEVTNSGAKLR